MSTFFHALSTTCFTCMYVCPQGGEDVRMDERVERLFDVMNGLTTHHAGCSTRHLALRTFGVIPLTPRLGLLEYVAGTKTLADAMMVSSGGVVTSSNCLAGW